MPRISPPRPGSPARTVIGALARVVNRVLGFVVWKVQAAVLLLAALAFFAGAWSVWGSSDDAAWLAPFGLAAGAGVLLLALAVRSHRKRKLTEWLDEAG